MAFDVALTWRQNFVADRQTLTEVKRNRKRNAGLHASLESGVWRIFFAGCRALLRSKLGKKRMLDGKNCKVYSVHIYNIYIYKSVTYMNFYQAQGALNTITISN